MTNPTPAEIKAALWPKRERKIKSKKVVIDGVVFDSKRESERYVELKVLQRCGEISKLQCHPTFTFIVQGMPVGKFTPDFSYHDKRDMVRIEDVKPHKASPKTGKMLPVVNREFGLKCRLMTACYGLTVEVVQ